jgi:hypothetical protein
MTAEARTGATSTRYVAHGARLNQLDRKISVAPMMDWTDTNYFLQDSATWAVPMPLGTFMTPRRFVGRLL